MTTQNINKEFEQLIDSAYNLVLVLRDSKSKNVATNLKKELESNKIDISSSWLSPEVNSFDNPPIFKNSNEDSKSFSIDSGSAKLTYLNSGQIEYKHNDSKTTLVFDALDYVRDSSSKTFIELEQKVTIQEEDGPRIVLDKEQVQKFLVALEVSKNTDDMLSIVNKTTDKITNLSSKNHADAEDLNAAAKAFETRSVNSILERIESGRPKSGLLKSLFGNS